MEDSFSEKVIRLIGRIPPGTVACYGQIAKLAGKPQGSRGVAWILHSSSELHDLPWHRVLNAQGRISFPEGSVFHRKQKKLLRDEGVEFSDSGAVDLKRFQWKKRGDSTPRPRNRPRMFSNSK